MRGLALNGHIQSWQFGFDTAMRPHADLPHSHPAISNVCPNRPRLLFVGVRSIYTPLLWCQACPG